MSKITKTEKECILKMHNYQSNPVMKMMFGEDCYNWRDPKNPTTITMNDVKKIIRFSEIKHINNELELLDIIKNKLSK